MAFDDAEVNDILTRLGLSVTATDTGWQATVPSWRFDIAIEEDLVEEIARIYGYDNIPNIAPEAHLTMSEHKEAEASVPSFNDIASVFNTGYSVMTINSTMIIPFIIGNRSNFPVFFQFFAMMNLLRTIALRHCVCNLVCDHNQYNADCTLENTCCRTDCIIALADTPFQYVDINGL